MISTIIVKYKIYDAGDFEKHLWHQKLVEATKRAAGFIDRTELPVVRGEEFHTVVLRFLTLDEAKKWMNSDLRRQILTEASIAHISGKEEVLHEGNRFWFQTDNKKKPPGWKQVIASFLAVYPLSIIVPGLVAKLFAGIQLSSPILSGVVVSVIISTLMVYLAIPLIFRLLGKWIYEK